MTNLTNHRATRRQATSAVAHTAPPPAPSDPLLSFDPVPHKQPRRNSITPDLQREFIAQLAATGIVTQAARHTGKSMEALYKLRQRPGAEGFRAAWDATLDRGVQRLEDCALERAIQGNATPIVSHGESLGWWDKPDNNLLRFLLQHRMPQKYGVQKLQPANAVYDSMRAQWEAEQAEQQRLAAPRARAIIDAKLEELRQSVITRRRAQGLEDDWDEAPPPEDFGDGGGI